MSSEFASVSTCGGPSEETRTTTHTNEWDCLQCQAMCVHVCTCAKEELRELEIVSQPQAMCVHVCTRAKEEPGELELVSQPQAMCVHVCTRAKEELWKLELVSQPNVCTCMLVQRKSLEN